MASSEERMKILEMVQEGKISAEDGAKLLAALTDSPKRRSRTINSSGSPRYIRVRVTDTFSGKTKVSVNLPLAFVDAGLSIASNFMPQMDADSVEDLSEAIKSGISGKIIDVMDEEDGEHIEIFIE